mmetsp:Transcript_34170/g.72802  ORF Transcript_34170/g.72802 Transcript_34170/m.72802 type:complete len:278 (+) Transcript_34170:893-1726(+)
MLSSLVQSITTRWGLTSASNAAVSLSMSRSSASSLSRSSSTSTIDTRHCPPCPANIFVEDATALTHTPKFKSLARSSFWAFSCRIRAEPSLPVPPSIATLTIVDDSVNAMCAALSARDASLASTTTATCLSEEPCAMTRMFTFALARELMKLADTPLCMAIPSPTIATMAMGMSVKLMELTFERLSSSSNADLRAANAACPWFSGTTTVMLDSELACVIMSTSMLAEAMAPMNLSATSAPPMTDAPSSVSNPTASTDVMPLMGISPLFALQFTTFPS